MRLSQKVYIEKKEDVRLFSGSGPNGGEIGVRGDGYTLFPSS